ncbi:hypothetical protein [Rhodopseudomonas pseudopalustris]|uniref:hypothetical protein n=1 Tax=Rhodopseudomonas pseudopalustris TaxID=1513892 RepID=UPI00158827B0|nr:hypothetical protein [Rhodopseudomonas pseudopalustris]
MNDDLAREIITAWREADPQTQAQVLDLLRRACSPDPAIRATAIVEAKAAAARCD